MYMYVPYHSSSHFMYTSALVHHDVGNLWVLCLTNFQYLEYNGHNGVKKTFEIFLQEKFRDEQYDDKLH